jgi:site-specific recombinase XerC
MAEQVGNDVDLSVGEAAELVIAALTQQQSLSSQTEVRTFGLINRFVTFLSRGLGVELIADVAPEHVAAFVAAATAQASRRPSVATMRLRRWAIRLFFRTGRQLGLTTADPTLDVVLPGRTNRMARPLSNSEVNRCRAASLHDLASTRLSVAWALGEATVRTAEISHIRVSELDLAGGRVWIHGSRQTAPRQGALTAWAARQIERRLNELGPLSDSRAHVAHVGLGNLESRVSFSAQALRETLTRAGLANQDRVQPASLAGWAGVQVFAATGRIEAVALALGVRSLDAAARLIDWNWHDPETSPPDG